MQIYDKLEFQCVAKPVRMRSCCFKTLQLPYKMRRCLFQHVANTEYCLKMLQTQKKHIQMRDFSVKMLETSWASVYLCDKIHICLPRKPSTHGFLCRNLASNLGKLPKIIQIVSFRFGKLWQQISSDFPKAKSENLCGC